MYLFKKNSKSSIFQIILTLFVVIFTSNCTNKYDDLDLSIYQYRDTKVLVKFVYDAALRLKKDGIESIDYFKENRSLYNTQNYYLYIYDMDGTNYFHAGMKHLEGKNLENITDKNGKKITNLVLNALNDKNNSHAWVHYSWWEPGKFYPVPKSSCHFKIKLSDGKELYVGGGMNYPHEEKEFVRIIVDGAVQLINEEGEKALSYIADPTSQYNYRDVTIFVFHQDGEILISPVINEKISQIKLLECIDEVGHKPFVKALKILESQDTVWEVFMAKNRYKRELVKKCLYLRKTKMSGKKVFVGAIGDLPQPP